MILTVVDLPEPFGPQVSGHLAAADSEAYVIDHRNVAVVLGQISDFQHKYTSSVFRQPQSANHGVAIILIFQTGFGG
jgi:hypothetical protein